MNTEQERTEVIKAYGNSPNWARKVKAMSPAQVHAIFVRLKKQGRI